MPLPKILEQRYASSLSNAATSSSQNINQYHLDIFTRVVASQPDEAKKIAEIYIENMQASSFNDKASLYGLIKLADVSNEARAYIADALPEGFIEEYKEDHNQDVANNALILEQVLAGAAMSDFQKKQSGQSATTTNHFNFPNAQNVALNSPGAVQSVKITNTRGLDEETRQLLEQLKGAFDKQDTASVKKIFGYIADKGLDIALNVALGMYFK